MTLTPNLLSPPSTGQLRSACRPRQKYQSVRRRWPKSFLRYPAIVAMETRICTRCLGKKKESDFGQGRKTYNACRVKNFPPVVSNTCAKLTESAIISQDARLERMRNCFVQVIAWTATTATGPHSQMNPIQRYSRATSRRVMAATPTLPLSMR